ncbi:MAG: hypothetical protein ACOC5L_01595 [Halobacteriota archaeon]
MRFEREPPCWKCGKNLEHGEIVKEYTRDNGAKVTEIEAQCKRCRTINHLMCIEYNKVRIYHTYLPPHVSGYIRGEWVNSFKREKRPSNK